MDRNYADRRRTQGHVPPTGGGPAHRGEVHWQAGRRDSDPRHAYVANLGDDTTYEVNVAVGDRVIGTVPSVPPYRGGTLTSTAECPCYVNICVEHRPTPRVRIGGAGGEKCAPITPGDLDEPAVMVRVSWRSAHGQVFTQTVRAA